MDRGMLRGFATLVLMTAFTLTAQAQNGGECDEACQQACRDARCAELTTQRVEICGEDGARDMFEVCPETLTDVVNFESEVYDADCRLILTGTRGFKRCEPNLLVASLLSQLDIDNDGLPDGAQDTDGDGLPDNWELGGVEAPSGDDEDFDRIVFFPAPSPVVPGTPPTPIFTRREVATSALNPDTDGDGLTDFIEVFGLMFIDENQNGILEDFEWNDFNNDGLPSPGEFPVDNTGQEIGGFGFLHDFDGFVFTDPTIPDTDGDGINDGNDVDPLINPRAFGVETIERFRASDNEDVDKDGLGNGMDLGNDLVPSDGPSIPRFEVIDNPQNIRDLLGLFRDDLLADGNVPESQIEDLIGADWDGNGLWRTTDVLNWTLAIDSSGSDPTPLPGPQFVLEDHNFFAEQTTENLNTLTDDQSYNGYGDRGIGLGWQEFLLPSGPSIFLPDRERRVWAILYSWRVPGFDIDGDGFIGVPSTSFTRQVDVTFTDTGGTERTESVPSIWMVQQNGRFIIRGAGIVEDETDLDTNRRLETDDRITIVPEELEEFETDAPGLDGVITAPENFPCLPCGGSAAAIFMIGLGLIGTRMRRRIG